MVEIAVYIFVDMPQSSAVAHAGKTSVRSSRRSDHSEFDKCLSMPWNSVVKIQILIEQI